VRRLNVRFQLLQLSDEILIAFHQACNQTDIEVVEEALAVKAGSNVLEGGTGSNWLVGATGADGGIDTFFVDNRGGQATWDSLLNFHIGDSLTLWGFNAASGSTKWTDDQGAAGYDGETLQVSLGNSTAATALVTFAGLSSNSAQFTTGTGTANGIDYLSVTRIA
jgi:hypothetical protein